MSRRDLGVCLGLLLCVVVVYAGSLEHDFVHFDDDAYVLQNPHLGRGVAWTLLPYDTTWMPVTWLSYAADHALGGRSPRTYHRTNLLIHGAASVLLFLALARLSGSRARSAFTAAVFALHPLHVESVAWIADRKDLLAGLFAFATLLAYARYVERPGPARYAAVTIGLLLGLLSKSVLVTLPGVLLLLDGWPLGRLQDADGRWRVEQLRRALLEKLPWLALAAGVAAINASLQSAGGELGEVLGAVPLGQRLASACVAVLSYATHTLWPSGLAVYYPHPRETLEPAAVALAAALLLGVSAGALLGWRTRPHLTVGWLWYLGLLLPVLGLVEVGVPEARADRYSYLPQTGLVIMAVWSVPVRWALRPLGRAVLIGAAAICLIALAGAARAQLRHWRDGVALFERALAVTPSNGVSQHGLGIALLRAGRSEEAIAPLREAAELAPGWAPPRTALGEVYAERGEWAEALGWYRSALRADPANPSARIGIAQTLIQAGRPAAALPHLRQAEAARPERGMADIHALTALALDRTGEPEAALDEYRAALALDPDRAEIHANLGYALGRQGRPEEALAHLERARRLGLASAELLVGTAEAQRALGREADAERTLAQALVAARAEDKRGLVRRIRQLQRAAVEP